jgi:hypothetical protein
MQYQQAPPPRRGGGGGAAKGSLGGLLACLCCCCVAEEGCKFLYRLMLYHDIDFYKANAALIAVNVWRVVDRLICNAHFPIANRFYSAPSL